MKEKLKEYGVYAGKGFAIGALMTVPGVSGGTLALILDIYDKLLMAVATLFKNLKKNVVFLAVVGISGIIGMFALSKAILWLSELAPVPVRFFFIGAILGGVPLLIRKAGLKKLTPISLIFILAGAAAVFALGLLPPDITSLTGDFSVSWLPGLCVSGIGLAVALIAPGISFSHMLMVLGIYERFYDALGSLDIAFLAVVLIPMAIFTLILIKIMGFAITRFPMQTYSAILGFVLASLKDVYIIKDEFGRIPEDWSFIDGLPTGWMIPTAILTFVAGCALVLALTMRRKNGEAPVSDG